MSRKQTPDLTAAPPQNKPNLKPLVSVADIARQTNQSCCPFEAYKTPPSRFDTLEIHAKRRVDNGANGNPQNHLQGLLGEHAVARHLGIADRPDTNLYADGDGGVDLVYNGATIDVKTVGRHRDEPTLMVDAYEPLRADYYVLAHRTGPNRCRLIGYAPKYFVANEPPIHGDNGPYHRVPQEYLFPIPPQLSYS